MRAYKFRPIIPRLGELNHPRLGDVAGDGLEHTYRDGIIPLTGEIPGGFEKIEIVKVIQ